MQFAESQARVAESKLASRPPEYSYVSMSGDPALLPYVGFSVNFSCRWTDYKQLLFSVFSCNISGSWKNDTSLFLNGTEYWHNVTAVLPCSTSQVAYCWYCVDVSGNWNTTGVKYLNTSMPIIRILDAHGKSISRNEMHCWEDEGQTYCMSGMPYCTYRVNVTIRNFLDVTVKNLKVSGAGSRAFSLNANQTITLSLETRIDADICKPVVLTLYYCNRKIDQVHANVTNTRNR